ncbi:MAG: helix-turn-helix domain-containing protein [Treponema sp.]|jgi:transcriptional regulator with XRE-family HTH domain|nr:helix-turn-helix domain-containing protein [Treponema sp.]
MSVNAAKIVFSHDKASIRHKDHPVDDKTRLRPFNSDKWKNCRLARGLGLEDVAMAINISPSYLFKIENERPNVSLDILQRLADFYGENLLYYFDEVENERHLVKKGTGEKIATRSASVQRINTHGSTRRNVRRTYSGYTHLVHPKIHLNLWMPQNKP